MPTENDERWNKEDTKKLLWLYSRRNRYTNDIDRAHIESITRVLKQRGQLTETGELQSKD